MKKLSDIEYASGRLLDLYLPDTNHFPLYVFFHGGGLTAGDRSHADYFAPELTEAGIAIASVEYRMYPEAKFPDYIDDAAASIAFMTSEIRKYGVYEKLIVGGSSAGGYLSMMLCFNDEYLNRVGMSPSQVDGWIHDAGQPTVHFTVLKNSGMDSRRVVVDERAPLYWIGPDKSYSRMLFLASDNDIPSRLEQTQLVLSTLRHFGVPEETFRLQIMHSDHCRYCFDKTPEGKNIFSQVAIPFIRSL